MSEHFPVDRPFQNNPPALRGSDEESDYIRARSADQSQEAMSLHELLMLLRRNAGLVFAVTLVITAIACWLVLTAPPRYRATATIRFQDERRMMTAGIEPTGSDPMFGGQTDPILSQIEILRSRTVLGVVVDSVRMMPRDEGIERLSVRLRVHPRDRTDLIDITYVSTNPAFARRVVNTTAQVFRTRSQETAREQSRRRLAFLDARLGETNATLATAQTALSQFQQREEVFSSRDEFAAQQVNLQMLEMRREELEAERRMYLSLLRGIREKKSGLDRDLRAIVSSTTVAQNPVVTQWYGQLVRHEQFRDSLVAAGAALSNPDLKRAHTMIDQTQASLVDALEAQKTSIDARLAALDQLRERQVGALAAMPPAQAEEARLLLEFQTIQRMTDQLREEEQKARIAEAVEGGHIEIIDLAPLPNIPIDDRRALKILVGILIGLLLGGSAAVARERLDTAVRSRDDIEVRMQTPSLAVIPAITEIAPPPRFGFSIPLLAGRSRAIAPRTGTGSGRELVTISHPLSAAAEAYRALRTSLIFSQASCTIRSLVVTSSVAGEGKSTTAANLAVSYAQQGVSVLLLDADLRRPRQHVIFRVPRTPGVSDFVLDRCSLDEAVQPTRVSNLFLLSAGVSPPNPAELIGSARMRTALHSLLDLYQLVIIDTSPLLLTTEGAILSARADATILVVRAGSTDRSAVQTSITQLRSVGANLVGVVLNDAEGKLARFTGYKYAAYYEEQKQKV